ncbi:hypothetical protein XH98_15420 [Bradyrhizobium sp. CCBAU 51745]|nr:hypothetical protein [Bradyrhizobium sp. CCBAU 51745]
MDREPRPKAGASFLTIVVTLEAISSFASYLPLYWQLQIMAGRGIHINPARLDVTCRPALKSLLAWSHHHRFWRQPLEGSD